MRKGKRCCRENLRKKLPSFEAVRPEEGSPRKCARGETCGARPEFSAFGAAEADVAVADGRANEDGRPIPSGRGMFRGALAVRAARVEAGGVAASVEERSDERRSAIDESRVSIFWSRFSAAARKAASF